MLKDTNYNMEYSRTLHENVANMNDGAVQFEYNYGLSSETSLYYVIIKHKAPNGMEISVKHFLSLYLSSVLLILNASIAPPLETVVWWILPLNPRVFG